MINFYNWLEDWKDPRTLVSILSAFVSATSLYFTRKFWLATNRPIVCASIITQTSGNIETTYNLVIYNAGNRPATNIKSGSDMEVVVRLKSCLALRCSHE